MRWTPNENTRAASRFVAEGRVGRLLLLAAASYAGGVLEALFLVLATKAAFSIDDGVDVVDLAGQQLTIHQLLGVCLALLAARTVLAVTASGLAASLMAGVVASVRGRLMRAFVTTSFAAQAKEKAGALHELMTTYSNQASGMVAGLSKMIIAGANLLALVGLAFVVDPRAALLLIASIVVLATLLAPLRRLMDTRAQASADAGMEFATSVSEVADLGLELHAFDVTTAAADRVQETIDRVESRARSVHFVTGLVNPVYSGMAFAALLGALAALSAAPTADMETLGAVTLLMLRSLSFGQSFQQALAAVATATPFVARTSGMLDGYAAQRHRDGTILTDRVERIDATAVSFAYPTGPTVLHGLTFSLGPREVVGVIGPSGAGKSTLVQLLLGLREPSGGTITADGRPIDEIAAASWAQRVAIVPQRPVLIAGSVRDNIAFYRHDLDDDDIVRAARLARIHDDIVAFPDGYDRDVGTHGGELSGGQQQRICIARAIAQRPDFLILDEPTSALDVRSEHLVRESLEALAETTTVVVIAHRLSTLEVCDRIMVVQDGTIGGFDHPDTLELTSDFYRDALELSGMR